MNIGHDAPLRVGKLMAVFCSCPCAAISTGTRIATINKTRPMRLSIVPLFLASGPPASPFRYAASRPPELGNGRSPHALNLDLEELLGIVFKDHLLLGSA